MHDEEIEETKGAFFLLPSSSEKMDSSFNFKVCFLCGALLFWSFAGSVVCGLIKDPLEGWSIILGALLISRDRFLAKKVVFLSTREVSLRHY